MILKEIEPIEYKLEETEDSPQFLGKLRFRYSQADVVNGNKRKYPVVVLKREVENLNKRLEKQGVAGNLEHPEHGLTRLDKVSHVLLKSWFEEKDKTAWAEAGILKTTSGRDLMNLIKSNVEMGASTRGYGSVNKEGEIEDDYKLQSIDIVAQPSFGDTTKIDKANVFESINKEKLFELNKIIDKETLGERIYEHLQVAYDRGKADGSPYDCSFEAFLQLDNILKETRDAVIEYYKKEGYLVEDFEEEDEELKENEKELSLQRKYNLAYLPSVQEGTEMSFEDWRKLEERTLEKEEEEKKARLRYTRVKQEDGTSLNFEQFKEAEKEKASEISEEALALYRQARLADYRGTFEQYKKDILNKK